MEQTGLSTLGVKLRTNKVATTSTILYIHNFKLFPDLVATRVSRLHVAGDANAARHRRHGVRP